MDKKSGKGSWYFTSVWGCPLCSHADVYKERRWDEKPEDPSKRFEYEESACTSHFL